MTRKSFTVEEANALIPQVERVLDRMRGLFGTAQEHTDQLRILDVIWGAAVDDPRNPDRAEYENHASGLKAALRGLEDVIEQEISGRGIRFPAGGLEVGLLDFPTTLDGRWVYLCWQRGEPAITAWHEVDGGFAGRQPLTIELAQRMGSEDASLIDDSMLDF